MNWEHTWNSLKIQGFSLGKVRSFQELVGLVWTVDATHEVSGRRYKADAATMDQAMARLEAMIQAEGN